MYRSMLGKVREGSNAPMFSALDVRGDAFDTRSYLGKGSLALFFYRGHWCATCRDELLDLKKEYARITAHGAEVVAISTDSLDEAKNLAVNLQLPYKVIGDPDHRIIELYDVYDRENGTAFITLFLVDASGIVRYKRPVSGPEDEFRAADIIDRLEGMHSPF